MAFLTFTSAPAVRRSFLSALLAPAVLLTGFLAVSEDPQEAQALSLRHLALRSSAPAADATVGRTLEEVRLFFTEVPQIEGTSIRIADGTNALVVSTEASADGEDPSQVFIRPEAALEPGGYTVHWRAIAQDGHAINGDFGFEVATE